ncbi:hypothetical protein [Methanosarcina sp. KYL-1]|nr:hypothetical protein [Methanosarcina sp. KYL-1]
MNSPPPEELRVGKEGMTQDMGSRSNTYGIKGPDAAIKPDCCVWKLIDP